MPDQMRRVGRPRRADGLSSDPVRSIRINEFDWEAGRQRASEEGHTPSSVINLLWKGYADGLLDLPQIHVTYTQPRTA